MLAKIREKTQGIIASLILGFVAIPFVLWGIGSYFRSDSDLPVAKVNGVKITQAAFRQRLEEIQGNNPRGINNKALKQLVLEGLISQTLITSQAEDNGYRIGDAELADMIHQIPNFQRDGKFESGLYEAVLSGQGMRPVDFESRLRQQSAAAQVQEGLSATAFVTKAEVSATLRMLRQQRRVSYALIDASAFEPKITVTDKDIDDYYQANRESFRAPEAVRVAYVALKAADVARKVEPTDEQLRQAYEAEAARYVTPAKRRISHILISLPSQPKPKEVAAAKARAEDVLKQVRAGADFASLARKYSDDPDSAKKGGDLGEIVHGVLPAELESAAAALKQGEVSEPVRTRYGFHLVKLTDYTPQKRKPFDSVKKELRELVRKRKGEDRFFEQAERFRDLVYEHPEGLETVANALDLKIEKSDWFTSAGGTGIAAQPSVVAAAFEPDVLNRERNSDAIDVDPETLAAVHVIDHRPSAIRPLADVRARIERTLKTQRARERAQALAQEWVKKLGQGEDIKAMAHAPGVKLHAAQELLRNQPGKVDRGVVAAVFSAPRPHGKPVIGQVDLGNQGFAVYALESVKDGDPASANAALKTRVRQQLEQHHGADYYTSYRAGLRKSADVKINTDQL